MNSLPQSHSDQHQQGGAGYNTQALQLSNAGDNPAAVFWPNDSPSYTNVDQLLSPGFIVDENLFQSFFPDYEQANIGYDHMAFPPNTVPGAYNA